MRHSLLISLLLPFSAFAESVEIRLQAQLWSKEGETISLIGEKRPVVLTLNAPAGDFDLQKMNVASPEVSAQVVTILSAQTEPYQLVFQTLLTNSAGQPLAQCSSIQTVLEGAVYGVGACTGFSRGKQFGVTFYHD